MKPLRTVDIGICRWTLMSSLSEKADIVRSIFRRV